MARNTVRVTSAHALPGALDLLRAEPSRSAVLLDVDGTLAPIVRHADDAHVPEPTRAPLIAIAKRYGFVACVSGRRAAVARRIVSIGSITYVGNHGAEILRGGATDVEVDPEFAAWRERVHAFADAELSDPALSRLRVRSEDKDAIVGFHWRGAPDEQAAEAAVRLLAARADEQGFAVHWGRKVLEVRPGVPTDKGRGIERVLEGADLDVALYVGDDSTDLDAFAALRRLVEAGRLRDSVCVGVSSDETPAQLRSGADLMVDGPRGVRELLRALAA
jgi:trehalose 6-phosphate phosphatase